MKIKFLGLVFAGIMLASASAQAALQAVSALPTTTINAASDSTFDLSAATGLDPNTSPIYIFNNASTPDFGLELTSAAKLTFTYLGKEAGFTNTFSTAAGAFSTDGSSAVGSSFSADYIADFVDFVFGSGDGGFATNNGTIDSPVQFAIAILNGGTSAILLLDDGGTGIDFDDMAIRVDVSQVPLPPAIWLLISAILGLVSFTRIRRNGGQAAA